MTKLLDSGVPEFQTNRAERECLHLIIFQPAQNEDHVSGSRYIDIRALQFEVCDFVRQQAVQESGIR